MPFPTNIAPIVFSTRYLRNAKNKWKNVTDPQKDPVVRGFSCSFKLVVYLFKYLRTHLFIH